VQTEKRKKRREGIVPKKKRSKKTRAELLRKDAKAGKLVYSEAYLELDANLEKEKSAWKKKNPKDRFSWGKLLKSKRTKKK